MNTRVTALSVQFFVIEVASHVMIQIATIALMSPFVQNVFSTWPIRGVVPMILPFEPVCVTAEVNIVEEEQNMWRRV